MLHFFIEKSTLIAVVGAGGDGGTLRNGGGDGGGINLGGEGGPVDAVGGERIAMVH